MWRLSLAVSAALAGCSAGAPVDPDPDPEPVDAAASRPADAAASPPTDAAPRADADRGDCLPEVPLDYGTPTPVDTSYWETGGDYSFYADLVDAERFQRLFINLHSETGVFSGPVEPGTYTIEGAATDYAQCGACVYLAVQDGDTPSTLYMARSGKLRVDTVGDQIHGELASADLHQIEIVYSGESCPGDGEWPCGNTACSGGQCGVQVEGPACSTHIDSLTF